MQYLKGTLTKIWKLKPDDNKKACAVGHWTRKESSFKFKLQLYTIQRTKTGRIPMTVARRNTTGYSSTKSRVSDPYSFFTDPDPDPEDPDGGQYGSGYGSGSNPDPDPIRIQGFNGQKLEKNNS